MVVGLFCWLEVKIEDEDKAYILLCYLSYPYEHLLTTLTYEKYSISLKVIQAALLSHSQRRQNAAGSSQGDDLYVKGKHEVGRT